MPEAMVRVTQTPTLITQVAGTPVAVTGAIRAQERTGNTVEIGRGTATVAPTLWFLVEQNTGPAALTLDQISPGGSGDHLWARALSGDVTIMASWA